MKKQTMKNFILTGMGNSGTTMLASLANHSKTWTVEHEAFMRHHATLEPAQVEEINTRIAKEGDYFGCVNCFLRYNLPEFKVGYKALLLRPMRDIYESWYSVKKPDVPDRTIANMMWSIRLFKKYIASGIDCYYFDRFTKEPEYTTELFRRCGIKDVTVTKEDLARKVHGKHKGDITYNDIPLWVRMLLERITGQFDKKYVLNHANDAIK